MITLVERISNIKELGTASGLYELYFSNNNYINEDEKSLILNEKEFYVLDKLYDGELACKIIN